MYEQHFDRVYRLVCRFGVSPGDVEDVTQQVFLTAYRRFYDLERIDNVPAWLRGIAVRVASDHHRWRRVRRVKKWLLDSTFRAAATEPETPERGAMSAERQTRVVHVLQKLSSKLRAVLVLTDIEEVPVAEVAETLQIPANTVRSRRRLAREAFAKLWTQDSDEESS